MIVVAIVAILAAIALPAYQDYVIRSQVSEGLLLSGGARAAVWDYVSNTGTLPADNIEAGLSDPGDISGRYVSQVEVDAAGVTVTFGGSANAQISGATLILVPTFTGGSLEWTCNTGSVASKYRPTACR